MRMDVLEQLLNEGQAVDNEVNAVLKKLDKLLKYSPLTLPPPSAATRG